MRLFTAVELPDEVRAAVAAEAREALAAVPDLRFVAEEHLHVTVRFLGETDPGGLPALRGALSRAAGSVAGGDAHTAGGIEALRWERVPRVFCAHVVDPAGVICGLERAATEALSALGIPPESRRFHPHVTVARVRRGGRRSPWRNSGPQRSLSDGPARPFDVRALTLFESELTPGGPRYRVIDRFPLGATTATIAKTATTTRSSRPQPSGSPPAAKIPREGVARMPTEPNVLCPTVPGDGREPRP